MGPSRHSHQTLAPRPSLWAQVETLFRDLAHAPEASAWLTRLPEMEQLQQRPSPRALGEGLPDCEPTECTAHAQRSSGQRPAFSGRGAGTDPVQEHTRHRLRRFREGNVRRPAPPRSALPPTSASLRGFQFRTPEAARLLCRTAARPLPWHPADCLRSQDREVPRLRTPASRF